MRRLFLYERKTGFPQDVAHSTESLLLCILIYYHYSVAFYAMKITVRIIL